MKRALDVVVAGFGLLVLAPVLALAAVAVWLEDRCDPLYRAVRVGLHGRPFEMYKLRTMVPNAEARGWDSTRADDPRITSVGRVLRRFKLDEFPQLWNVLVGEMSLVGPRPNIDREVDLYDAEERRLLEAIPGITDLSSIVYADLAERIRGYDDPNLAYRRLVRPGKSRLGLFYVDRGTFWMDIAIVVATVLGLVSRRGALRLVRTILNGYGADAELLALTWPPSTSRVAVREDAP